MVPILDVMWEVLGERYGLLVSSQSFYRDRRDTDKKADGIEIELDYLVSAVVVINARYGARPDTSGRLHVEIAIPRTGIRQELLLENPNMIDDMIEYIDTLSGFIVELRAVQTERPLRKRTVVEAILEFRAARQKFAIDQYRTDHS